MTSPRSVLITGAGRGLGQAMARHLSRNMKEPGSRLLLHYSGSQQGAEQVAQEARQEGTEVVLLRADLGDPQGQQNLVSQVERHTSTLDVLIHNAGVYQEQALLESTPEQWRRTLEINCTAVFALTQGLLPLLRAAATADNRPRVLAIGDSGADRVLARELATPYHVSKLGLHVLARSLAAALGPQGINCNMISPGFLENSVGKPHKPIPAGRVGEFADILGALDYLLSAQADYVSGANLVVSGGWNV